MDAMDLIVGTADTIAGIRVSVCSMRTVVSSPDREDGIRLRVAKQSQS